MAETKRELFMRRISIMFLALAIFSAACSGGGEPGGETAPTTTAAGTTEETTTTTATEAPAVFNISQVEQSVVQIQGQGTFIDSGGAAAYNAGFTGTGFVISEDGLAVTNNHVVQGAATLDVSFSDGESLNARIVAVSECSDLAIVDLEGDGYTPLSFRKDPITVGLDVFSAGFPAADEIDFDNLDFTLTSGIVGSTNAGGESSWASVDGVLQHDAQILGGNSGGPLVDENGEVIGINYAGSDDFNTNYAIGAQDARPVIEQLMAGNNVDSIGINGEAQQFDSGLSGIFISSVESGSPADSAGIEPGDVLISLENLVVATDGTMSDYCDVLRTQGDDSTMDVEIYRPSLDLVLSGQINGDPIELPLIAATVLGGDTDGPADSGTSAPVGAPYSYTEVTDDQGLISVSIPTAWTEVDGTPNPNFGPSIWASPDIAGWQDSWSVPGIIVESAPGRTAADIGALLLERDFSGVCDDLGSEPYEDPLYAGTLQIYGNCGGTDTYYIILAAAPLNAGYLVRVEVQAPQQRDLEAADEALATFIANI
ncbi:MAG: serine protease Do [Candidatus Aldehydirespiratoraceae bacterium]|jgi:serine protease Do